MQVESIQRAPDYSYVKAAVFMAAIDDLGYDYLESADGGRSNSPSTLRV